LAGHDYTLDGRHVELPPGRPLIHCGKHWLPIHGLLHASPYWRMTARHESRIAAQLDFTGHKRLLAAFPFPHMLEIAASLSLDRLTITRRCGPPAECLSRSRSGSIPTCGCRVSLAPPGRSPSRPGCHLILDERGIPNGAGERRPATRFELADRSFDDGIDGLARRSAFSVAGGGRTTTVELESGYPAAQIFSPAHKDFICFEPMTAPTKRPAQRRGTQASRTWRRIRRRFSIAVR
jgi:aldose 1-epimerase